MNTEDKTEELYTPEDVACILIAVLLAFAFLTMMPMIIFPKAKNIIGAIALGIMLFMPFYLSYDGSGDGYGSGSG